MREHSLATVLCSNELRATIRPFLIFLGLLLPCSLSVVDDSALANRQLSSSERSSACVAALPTAEQNLARAVAGRTVTRESLRPNLVQLFAAHEQVARKWNREADVNPDFYYVRPLQGRFHGEHLPRTDGRSLPFLSSNDRRVVELRFAGGMIFGRDHQLADTRTALAYRYEQMASVVMLRDGRFLMLTESSPELPISSITGEFPVAWSGLMQIMDGRIVTMNDVDVEGRYPSPVLFTAQAVRQLQSHRIHIPHVFVTNDRWVTTRVENRIVGSFTTLSEDDEVDFASWGARPTLVRARGIYGLRNLDPTSSGRYLRFLTQPQAQD